MEISIVVTTMRLRHASSAVVTTIYRPIHHTVQIFLIPALRHSAIMFETFCIRERVDGITRRSKSGVLPIGDLGGTTNGLHTQIVRRTCGQSRQLVRRRTRHHDRSPSGGIYLLVFQIPGRSLGNPSDISGIAVDIRDRQVGRSVTRGSHHRDVVDNRTRIGTRGLVVLPQEHQLTRGAGRRVCVGIRHGDLHVYRITAGQIEHIRFASASGILQIVREVNSIYGIVSSRIRDNARGCRIGDIGRSEEDLEVVKDVLTANLHIEADINLTRLSHREELLS